MKISDLELYYSRFHEESRLDSRHGIVEYSTAMSYISDYAKKCDAKRILDLGAGAGRYSAALCDAGFDVTAVEVTKCNFEKLRALHKNIKAWRADARNLSFLHDDTFDLTLIAGPLYHLHGDEEKVKVLQEARRVTKRSGYIFSYYITSDYAIVEHCLKKGSLAKALAEGTLNPDFSTNEKSNPLYSYVRLADIDRLNEKAALRREKILALDGPADYIRPALNAMSAEDFAAFLCYQKATCERADLLGASSHVMDIVRKERG